ncbi:MAG: response regulator [Bacteroidales bacterium]|nr:response regulator [Bacteroidales bacterium]
MSEELKRTIRELEERNKILTSATEQWDHLQQIYLDAHARLQRSEAFNREIRERMEAAMKAGDLAWWDWNYKTGVIHYDPELARMLGYPAEELPKHPAEVEKLIHPDDRDEFRNRLQKHVEGVSDYYEAEFRLYSKNGFWKWFYDRGKVVEKDIMGNPVSLSGVLIDISDRKLAEKELLEARNLADASSKAKSLFLANMSHEIYTPLAGVVGMADILKQSGLAQEQLEYINIIVNAASNLMSVLNDIMEFIQAENRKIELVVAPLAITRLMQEMEADTLGRCADKGLELLTYCDPQIPDYVMGDPRRVRQLLQIFIHNAIKFTDEGRVIIAIEFAGWDEEAIRIRFRVTDTGIGIPGQELGNLFHSFTRVNTKIGKYGGSGLGLAIAKHLVELMNGAIEVESKEGEGSTFSFTVEFDRLIEQESFPDVSDIKGRRILLVDPDQERRSILKNYLLVWECEAEEANFIQEALDQVKHKLHVKKPFDMILIEYGSFAEDPELFFKQLDQPEWAKSSPLLIAARNQPLLDELIRKAGFRAVLLRPFVPGQLIEAIRETVSGKSQELVKIGESQFREVSATERKRLKVLLVEDNLINQRVAQVTIKKLGHEVTLAENGREATALFEPGKFDLILMDILMPEMNGLEATTAIREIESERKADPVHICAITANINKEDEEACYEAGMNSYITKPFRLEELNAILGKC